MSIHGMNESFQQKCGVKDNSTILLKKFLKNGIFVTRFVRFSVQRDIHVDAWYERVFSAKAWREG